MKCKYCEKEFEPTDGRQKFCCKDCYRAYYNEYRRKKAEELKTTDPERVKKTNARIAELAKVRLARKRRAVVMECVSTVILNNTKSNSLEDIVDIIEKQFTIRRKK